MNKKYIQKEAYNNTQEKPSYSKFRNLKFRILKIKNKNVAKKLLLKWQKILGRNKQSK